MEQLETDKDQHMLTDLKILKEEIKSAELKETDEVIEIGAGTGNLTKEIVKKVKKLTAFETDLKFKDNLREIEMENKNLEIIWGNALDYPWKGKVVSNIPYSLSEPVIMKAIASDIEIMVLIVGENLKEILEAKESKLGIIANLFYKITPIDKVDKNKFFPQPRVNSWMIKFVKKKITDKDKILLEVAFSDKKIKNALMSSFILRGKTKNQSREIIDKMKIDQNVLNKPSARMTGKFMLILKDKL